MPSASVKVKPRKKPAKKKPAKKKASKRKATGARAYRLAYYNPDGFAVCGHAHRTLEEAAECYRDQRRPFMGDLQIADSTFKKGDLGKQANFAERLKFKRILAANPDPRDL